MFSGAEPFVQFWKRALWGACTRNYFEYGSVAQEEILFKEKVYTQKTDG